MNIILLVALIHVQSWLYEQKFDLRFIFEYEKQKLASFSFSMLVFSFFFSREV